MRLVPLLFLLPASLIQSTPSQAQRPDLELQAGLGYARLFDAGGLSFSAVVDRGVGSSQTPLQHALGLSFWYAHTRVASEIPESSLRRDLVGLGIRYQLGLRRCCGPVHPYMAVPLQVLRSSIEDVADLQPFLAAHGIPEPPNGRPAEDQAGGAWGWGAGLELGVRLGLAENLDVHTSMQGLYHDIYADESRNGAWSWHAGLIYRFGRSL